MTVNELPITGYLDRLSHRPGGTVTAHVSVRDGVPYKARLVRVISADPNPVGPGMRFEDLPARFNAGFPGRHQPIVLGSRAVIDRGPPAPAERPRTWTALVCPGVADREQVVIAEADFQLSIDASGAAARIGPLSFNTGTPLRAGLWYRVWLSFDPATRQVLAGQTRLGGAAMATATRQVTVVPVLGGGPVFIAAADAGDQQRCFTGKIEAPAILNRFIRTWIDPLTLETGAAAAWDFAQDISTQTIHDTGPHACHGYLVNLPARAMVGARWTGTEQSWRHAPAEYAAIHFHADDLGDCGWLADFSWVIPDDLPSGSYAFHLQCDAGEDWLPFYVLPKRNGPYAPIAVLASTFTYQAYANHARFGADERYFARVRAWGAYPYNPDQYPIYGRSTYNRHLDGSGVTFSSRRRPILTMRPGYLTFNDSRGSGLRHYQADSHLLAWLEAKGIAFDIITDEDLDEEGAALLRPYRAVLTGSHPEYHTSGTLDALSEYTRHGGRLAYLGGNGFYWRIARVPSMPWAIELRRAEGGVRTWAAEPGEYYHQFDGHYGGLWRRNRRPPQMLAGVGFSGQGAFEGTYYRLLPEARDPRFAWMFDGITGDILGDYGLSGGGAAGFEMDRADFALGTPDGAVILARSENPPASFFTVPEEVLAGRLTITGERLEELTRAEIVYFDLPGGGSVFSTGSITFCGSLWRDGWDGPVSRLLENVVRRFQQP